MLVMSVPLRTWLRHTTILIAVFVVAVVGARLLGYEPYLPLWASLPTLVLLATMDYVGTVGIPGRRRTEPPRDEPDAAG